MEKLKFLGRGLAYLFYFIWGLIAFAMIIPFVITGAAIAVIVTSPIWIPRVPGMICKLYNRLLNEPALMVST